MNEAWLASAVDRGLRILIIIAAIFAGAKFIAMVSAQLLSFAQRKSSDEIQAREREKRLATVVKLVNTTLRVTMFGFATLMILREIGLDITPLLTGAGIAGVAVGFGAQSLVKDMIAGFFILVEDQVRIGDVIKINGGISGSVERMELRVTAIRDGDGTLHVVPNGEIKSVSNMTYEFSRAVVNIPLAYRADLKRVSDVIEKSISDFEGDPKWKKVLRGRPDFLGVTDFHHEVFTVQIVAKTNPHAQWETARELRARVMTALEESEIRLGAVKLPSI